MREKMFAKADADKDGKISKAEMQAVAPKDGDGNGPSFEEIFSEIDSDGDGYITETEDAAAAEKMQKMGPPPGPPPGGGMGGPPDASQMASDLFSDADEDEDGTISLDDLSNIIHTDGKGPSADEIFELADADGDGAISQDDLASALEKLMEKHKNDEPPTGYSADGAATYESAASSVFSTIA